MLFAAVLAGCIHGAHPDTVNGAVLGRVVIYRNGVAFYERHAMTQNGSLSIRVPRGAVDDFLKSLTVLDPVTHKPLSISIPRKEEDASGGSMLTLDLETATPGKTDVLLTYVTESPAWKPSYRAVVGDNGKVMLESWAIVDNVSSEDWKNVLVGVGASSAMSFRYDLWSVRRVDRDLLQGDDKFAVAPPQGVSPYEATGGDDLGTLDSSEVAASGVAAAENTTGTAAGTGVRGVLREKRTNELMVGATVVANGPAMQGEKVAITDDSGTFSMPDVPPGTYTLTIYYNDSTYSRGNVVVQAGHSTTENIAFDIKSQAKGEVIQIQASAPIIDQGSTKTGVTISSDYTRNVVQGRTFGAAIGAAAGAQADGLGTSFSGASSFENTYTSGGDSAPSNTTAPKADDKIKAMAQKVATANKDVVIEVAAGDTGRASTVRDKLVDAGVPAKRIHVVAKDGVNGLHVLAVAPGQAPAETPSSHHGAESDEPVGETHFIAERPMNVKAGTSAMVAMVHAETPGGVVYLYDPISDRGDTKFAFKALELDNPTGDTLEPGPMTVYGEGRFVGEGLTEAVPPHAAVVVPFASDHQIVVTRTGSEDEKISKLETVQRGVLTAEVQRHRVTHFEVTSRLDQPTKVFLRHKLEDGWKLEDAPKKKLEVGSSSLFEVDVPAKGSVDVAIYESSPMDRTLQLSSEGALDMMRVYLDEPDASPKLKAQLKDLLATHRAGADLAEKIATMRDQLGEYKTRNGELHAQLVTLKAVHTANDLMGDLRQKMVETSNKVQKLTIGIVDAEEQLMLARLKFANQLSDLHLEDPIATASKR
ncbi:MAG TPA: carboxypeptidase regulatory-like domain-containing protein [Kofleriaceae bacterium]